MPRWGMVVDLRKCIGCESCVTACSEFHHVHGNRWRRVIDCADNPVSDRQRLFVHQTCMHCDDPPCVMVCPTTASYIRSDGIVLIDHDKCVGCGSCVLACPYGARTVLKADNVVVGESELMGSDVRSRIDKKGLCTKCTFCHTRIDEGLGKGLTPGEDEAATPMCVATCSSGALHFGDLDDPNSRINHLIRDNLTTQMQVQMSTGPAVFFIVPEWWSAYCEQASPGEKD